MSLMISGDISGSIGFTSPTELQFGTDVSYSTIIEYTYNRGDIPMLVRYLENFATDEEKTIITKVINHFKDTGLHTCTIQVES